MRSIEITIEDSEYIEKLFYEYNATLDIITHLMNSSTLSRQDILEEIIERCESRKIELEKGKINILHKYNADTINSNYKFNFIEHTIEFV